MIDKLNSKYMVLFDWILALATVFYGAHLMMTNGYSHYSLLVLIFGFLGCLLAYFRPANLMKSAIKRSLVKR